MSERKWGVRKNALFLPNIKAREGAHATQKRPKEMGDVRALEQIS